MRTGSSPSTRPVGLTGSQGRIRENPLLGLPHVVAETETAEIERAASYVYQLDPVGAVPVVVQSGKRVRDQYLVLCQNSALLK